MSEETAQETTEEKPELDANSESSAEDAVTEEATADQADAADGQEVETAAEEAVASAPEFAELTPGDSVAGAADLNRLNDVKVVVSAELGRTKVAIEDLLRLNIGSIFELNRSIDSPVELLAQGVPLGNGEVVVVDGSFAIRIQEIYSPQ